MVRRSGRVVEGGTLLRCYTSQRGIEGSNPSSSASKAPRLQELRESEEAGQVRSRPLLHQQVHQRSQNALIRGREFVSTATRSCGRLRGVSRPPLTKKRLYVSSYAKSWMRLSENDPSSHLGE